jgi:hypothetical protein
MIDLSQAKLDKRVPKNRFKAELDGIDTITWLYKISPDTADFRHGDEITEIQIFNVSFKIGRPSKREFIAIQKEIPYPILFVVGNKNYFVAEGELFESNKQFIDRNTLNIERKSAKLTDLYETIVTAFIPIKHHKNESVTDLVARYKKSKALEKKITVLQRKVDMEKQPNKRIELNKELRRLKNLANQTR